jgi:hypothetical protein
MSEESTYNIRCPQCGCAQDVLLHDSVNVQTHPEMRDRIMSNQLNAVTCEQCSFGFRVDKPLLYHDPNRNFMIHLIPGQADLIEGTQNRFSEWMRELSSLLPSGVRAPDLHLVVTRPELVERIFLLEAGLNERVIEYIKYIIYSRNLERLPPETKVLLFDAQDSSDDKLCFVVQDIESKNLEGVLHYSREAYTGLCEMFDRDEQTPSLMELYPGPYVSARILLLREAQVE